MSLYVMTSDNGCNLIPSFGVLEELESNKMYYWVGIELAPTVPWLVTLLTHGASWVIL